MYVKLFSFLETWYSYLFMTTSFVLIFIRQGGIFFLRNQTIRLKKLIEFFTKSVALQHDIGLR